MTPDPYHLVELLRSALPMQDFGRLVRLCALLMDTAQVPGEVVEFGCFEGRTAVLLSALKEPGKSLWLYDSFAGLPTIPAAEAVRADHYYSGAMKASPATVVRQFASARESVPQIQPGWFWELQPHQLPGAISFAHLDGDISTSIRQSLDLVYPRLSVRGICVIDDYHHTGLPGVSQAVDRFVTDHPEVKLNESFGPRGELGLSVWFRKSL